MRYPAVSPDGQRIAFSYQGDLYTVASGGGVATPITRHAAYDFRPVWAPDGRTIAFASDRHGNFDVFIIPSEGGTARRLTYHSADDLPTAFSPDGAAVLFTSSRMNTSTSAQFPSGLFSHLYSVSTDGARPTRVLSGGVENARFGPAGDVIVYHDRRGYENEWRKHHTSSVARRVWVHDVASGAYRQLSTFEGENRDPVVSPDGRYLYYLSERSGSFNVWRQPVGGGAVEQITRHESHPVRFLSMAGNGDIVYGFHGGIYRLAAGGTDPQRIPVIVRADANANDQILESLTSGATEMALSPNGKEIAFVVRGEVFVTAVEYGTTKRVTSTPEQERSVSFRPDGRALVYASERNGSWNLYETEIAREEEPYFFSSTLLSERPILETDQETFQPAYSPAGDEVAFLENRTTLRVVTLASGAVRTVLPGDLNYSYSDGDQWYQWSPDGSHFLVQYLADGRWPGGQVGLVPAAGGDVVNLTRSGYRDLRPQWAMDGTMLTWFTDRHGMRSHGSWGSQSDVYGMFLTQDAFNRFTLDKEEFSLLREREDDDPEDEGASGDERSRLDIELRGTEDRVLRLTIHSSNLTDARLTPDGSKLVYLSAFEGGHDLWVHDFREAETKLLAKLGADGGSLQMDDEGKLAFVLADGRIRKIDLGTGSAEPVAFSAAMTVDTPAEREYLFEHVWRQVREKFYVEDLHGVDWEFYRAEYEPLLAHINNNHDFAELLSELLGELNASHTGARYRSDNNGGDQTAALGVFFDEAYDGPGLRIAEVLPGGPLWKEGEQVATGTIVEAIDGVSIAPEDNVYRLLNRKAGARTLLSLWGPAGERKELVVRPITQSAQNELLYRRWVQTRRDEVERLSGGRLGYVHIRGMNDPSFRDTYSEILGRYNSAEALIVDTRFNGGGWLHDDLVTFLSGDPYITMSPRGQNLGTEPIGKWQRPSIVIMSEGNYSDAHMFPFAYKELGIGELVGMPVAGTGTAVWWERLQDQSLVFGIPQVGMLDPRGAYLENQQLMPDHLVDNDPASLASGEDRQLEKAVEVLLRQLRDG
jgi:tricorn protease